MATKLIITAKFFVLWLYNAILVPTATILNEATNERQPPDWILIFLITMMFVPEVVATGSKSFRDWIRSGIEDADNTFNKGDMKDLIMLYSSLWSLRVFLFMSWFMLFYNKEIQFHIYIIPLLGSFGIAGLPIIKSFYGKK